MKDTHSIKKIFVGIIILILIAAVGYYWANRGEEKLQAPVENKKTNSDSTAHIDPEKIPPEISEKPEINPKDGSVKIVEEFVRSNAKNPATFRFLEWSELTTKGKYWKVKCKYSGISSFNKEVTTSAWFYIQNNKVVYTKVISKI